MVVNWTQIVERYIREGRTVSGGCGASQSEKSIASQQQQNFQQFSNEAGQVFGNSSQIFKDLTSSFEPVLAAGPGQSGFTPQELAALNSQAITTSGAQYRNAATAAGERIAASGGGNAVLPSGTTAAVQGNIATAGAASTANELNQIALQNAQTGRQNWMNAAGVLSGAGNVFNPATNFDSSTTGAGSAAMSGASTVQNANRQWIGDVTGILGDAAQIGAGIATGGMSTLASAGAGAAGGGAGPNVPEFGS